MTKSNKIFDDIAQLAGSAAGLMNDLRQQMKEDVKSRVDELATKMDLVPREDLERVEALLEKTRKDQETLEKRLAALEAKK